jgi:hypothetical protein
MVMMPQALRPVMPRLAAMSRGRASVGDAQQNPGVAGQKLQPPYFVNHSF